MSTKQPKNGKSKILEIYLLKRLEERLKDAITDRRLHFIEGEEPTESFKVDDGTLELAFTATAGRKKFSPEKAASYLKNNLSKEIYSSYFTEIVIERKPGAEAPPKELMDEMKKYFNVSRKDVVTEEVAKTYASHLDLEECYDRGEAFFTMRTPSRVSDKELLDMANQRQLDMVSKLLLPA
jgi:acid phosphatase class B